MYIKTIKMTKLGLLIGSRDQLPSKKVALLLIYFTFIFLKRRNYKHVWGIMAPLGFKHIWGLAGTRC